MLQLNFEVKSENCKQNPRVMPANVNSLLHVPAPVVGTREQEHRDLPYDTGYNEGKRGC